MNIRTFETEEELSKAYGLFIKIFAEPPFSEKWGRKILRKNLISIFRDGGKGFCYYAEHDGKIIGFLFARKFAWGKDYKIYIEHTGVDKKHRQKGVANKLYKQLEDTTRSSGMTNIILTTHPDSKGFLFWKKHGYTKDKYIHMGKKL